MKRRWMIVAVASVALICAGVIVKLTETAETADQPGIAHVDLPATATSRIPLWLLSGWGCRGRRLSTQ